MPHKEHPWRRGALMAAVLVLALVLGHAVDIERGLAAVCAAVLESITRESEQDLQGAWYVSLCLMLIPGAFLASIPSRIRQRKQKRDTSTVKGCVAGFAGGVVLSLAAGLAGGGGSGMVSGMLQGDVSAFVFAGCTLVGGLLTARMAGKEQRV